MGDAVSPIEWAVRMTLLGGVIDRSVEDSNIIEPKSSEEEHKYTMLSQESILMQKVEVTNDPEAAAIVFQSGVPITMYGLDVFMRPGINREQATQMQNSTNPAAQALNSCGLQPLIHRLYRPIGCQTVFASMKAVIRPGSAALNA